MEILKTDKEIESFLGLLRQRAAGEGEQTTRSVKKILSGVSKDGDRALVRFTRKFDGHCRIRLDEADMERAAQLADPVLLDALKLAARRIRRFHEKQLKRLGSWSFDEGGITLGQIARPLQRVGVYVPGGKAAYPSTVLMNVIPAQVAGVPEIALAVPTPKEELNPAVMAAIRMLGVKEVYSIGGAQAVAAFAYGTDSIRKVDKITGPGNIFVATAKRLVFGLVDIDMIAGPSEILIIADDSANPEFIAADLLSQAEHDELASAILVTDSAPLARKVIGALKSQLKSLERNAIAQKSLARYGAVIIARDMGQAVELANRIAPEHLEVLVRKPEKLVHNLRNAGAIFVGPWSPEPVGDYAAGPNHTLPTGGTARFSSPLGVYDFIKYSSYLNLSRKGFNSLAGAVETVAQAEGLTAHRNSVAIRRRG